MEFRIILFFVLASFSLNAQIDSWQKIYDAKEVLESFRIADETITVSGLQSIYCDSQFVFTGTSVKHDSTKAHVELLVVESLDRGKTWELIGRFSRYPWKYSSPTLKIRDIYYTPVGDVVFYADTAFLRYDRPTKSWKQTWSQLNKYSSLTFEVMESSDSLIVLDGLGRYWYSSDNGESFIGFREGCESCGSTPNGTLFKMGNSQPVGSKALETRYRATIAYDYGIRARWSPLFGLAISGPSFGDDDARTWDKLDMDTRSIFYNDLGVSGNGTLLTPIKAGKGHITVSSDLGRTWNRIRTPTDSTDITVQAKNVKGKEYFLKSLPTSDIYQAKSFVMSESLRWPLDSSQDRPSAQTFICPSPLAGEIEVEVSSDQNFGEIVFRKKTSERYAFMQKIAPRSSFWWRYRHRFSDSSSWGPWTKAWMISTGAQAWWKSISTYGNMLKLRDGSFVRSNPGAYRVERSVDEGRSWSKLTEFWRYAAPIELWESPGGRLFVKIKSEWFNIDVKTGANVYANSDDIQFRVGATKESMYGMSGKNLVRSTDDGSTWDTLTTISEPVSSLILDRDGSILIGCSYRINNRGLDSMRYWVGGLFRYDVKTAVLDTLTAHTLPQKTALDYEFRFLSRDVRGDLYHADTRHMPEPSVLRSTDDGRTWRKVDSLCMPEGFPSGVIALDRQRNLIVGCNDGRYFRQIDKCKWERLDDGLVYRKPNPVGQSTPIVSIAWDGTNVIEQYGKAWILYSDVVSSAHHPKTGASFQAQEAVEFSWNPIPGVTSYVLKFDSGHADIVVGQEGRVIVSDLSPGSYTWYVQPFVNDSPRAESSRSLLTVDVASSIERTASSTVNRERSLRILTQAQCSSLVKEIGAIMIFDLNGRVIDIDQPTGVPQLIIVRAKNEMIPILMISN